MNPIDVIILSNSSNSALRKITENAIESLLDSENQNEIYFNIIIIESNSKEKAYEYPQTVTIFPKQKFGFHKYLNIGLKNSHSPFVCLCNNDLIFHNGWATEILSALKADDELKSVSPACSIHHPQVMNIPLNSGVYYGYEVRKEVAGWCLFFKREILTQIGELDEHFKFWYADNDYAKTLEKHKIKHALISNAVVDHLESKTLETKDKSTQYQLTQGARYYYEYKWESRTYGSYLNCKRKLMFKSLKHKIFNKFNRFIDQNPS